MATTDRLRERTRAQTIETVQDVALRLMGEQGFDDVTVTAIATEAGVSPSTVYRHFGTKEALILTGDGLDRLLPDVDAAIRETAGGEPSALLRRAIAGVLGGLDTARLLPRLRLVYGDPGLTMAFEHHVLDHRHVLADLLAARRGKSRGRVRDHALAGAALGLLVTVLDRWQRGNGETSLVKLWKRGCDVALSVSRSR